MTDDTNENCGGVQTDPAAGTGALDGEARHMSIPEASGILMELARKRTMSIDQVNALEMAVRRLMCRHFQRQRNWAKRREARRLAAALKVAVASDFVVQNPPMEGGRA